ncbi:unnamed protein product, partial [Protopolystoma xenopodis]
MCVGLCGDESVFVERENWSVSRAYLSKPVRGPVSRRESDKWDPATPKMGAESDAGRGVA